MAVIPGTTRMCSTSASNRAKKAQSTSWAATNSAPSLGFRLVTAAAISAGAQCPINMTTPQRRCGRSLTVSRAMVNQAMMDEGPDQIASLSFEDALRALEDVVRRLESGEVALDQSISLYERGEAL